MNRRTLSRVIVRLLAQRFGPEWEALIDKQRKLLCDDFAALLLEEYDTPDPTMDGFTAEENAATASFEYRRRIGGGNLAAYVKSLAVAK